MLCPWFVFHRSASASFKSASAIEEDDVDSPSSEEAEPEHFNKLDSSSVWTIPYTVIHLFTIVRKAHVIYVKAYIFWHSYLSVWSKYAYKIMILVWYPIKEEDENTKGKGRKRQATTKRGRGRGSGSSKRGRKNESSSSLHRLLSSKDDDVDEDDEDIEKKLNRSQPRVCLSHLFSIVLLLRAH